MIFKGFFLQFRGCVCVFLQSTLFRVLSLKTRFDLHTNVLTLCKSVQCKVMRIKLNYYLLCWKNGCLLMRVICTDCFTSSFALLRFSYFPPFWSCIQRRENECCGASFERKIKKKQKESSYFLKSCRYSTYIKKIVGGFLSISEIKLWRRNVKFGREIGQSAYIKLSKLHIYETVEHESELSIRKYE